MAFPAWTLEADFDRSGSYETDLTSEVTAISGGITIDRGMGDDGIYRISSVTINLTNELGTYTPGYTASARYGQLRPGVPIRLKATHSAIAYVLWTGFIQRFRVSHPGPDSVCTIHCTDLADYLRQFTPVNVLVATRTTSAAYLAIAAAVGLAAADYNFPAGAQSLPVHWVRNADALTAFADVLQSELGGSWFIDADGVIQGQPRTARLGTAAAQTWGDGTNVHPSAAIIEIDDSDLISSASVQANVFMEGESTELIFYMSRNAANPVPDSLAIAAGDTYIASLDFATPVESMVTPVAGTDYTANTAIGGTGTDVTASLTVSVTLEGAGFLLSLKNTTAAVMYVTKFEIRGLPQNYIVDRPIFTSTKSIVGDKLSRGMQAAIPFADDSVITRDYSVALLRTWRYEYERLTLDFDWDTDANTAAMLAVELGDLIKFADVSGGGGNPQWLTNANDWWYVEAIRHDLGAATIQRSSITLIPSYLFRNLGKIVHDNFNRANAVGDLGMSTQGAVWANDAGFDINANGARANSDVLQVPDLDLGTGSADQVVEVSLAAIGAGDEVGVTLRKTDASNFYNLYLDKGDSTVRLEKNVAGVVYDLDSSGNALILSGNEITDATRALALQGDGLSGDSSFGIWPAATNLVTNGGFETNTTGWTAQLSGIIARITSQFRFGAACLQLDCSGQYAGAYTGVTVVALSTYTFSIWIKRTGVSNNFQLYYLKSDLSILAQTTVPAILGWQRVSVTGVHPAGTTARLLVQNDSVGGSETVYIDGVQAELGSVATPYIETDGATAARSAARVQMPVAGVLNATQGWVAMRVRMGDPSTGSARNYFEYGDGANNRLLIYAQAGGNGVVGLYRIGGGAGGGEAATTVTWATGDIQTVVGAWNSTTLKGSRNGAAFVSAAQSTIPVLAATSFDVGGPSVSTEGVLRGDVLWFACGTGTLTDANAATLNAYGNSDPTKAAINAAMPAAVCTAVIPFAGPKIWIPTSTAEIRAMIQGTRLRCWVDRKLLIDTTDSSLATGAKVGLFARNANATATFEDFYSEGL
ncbi:MAG: phage head spike fiber domain-containing protein [Chloroflexota bacterium]